MRAGLEHKPHKAKFFYGVLIVASVAGMALNLTPLDPVKALYWSAVINGVVAVPLMIVMMLMSSRSQSDGRVHTSLVSETLRLAGDSGDGRGSHCHVCHMGAVAGCLAHQPAPFKPRSCSVCFVESISGNALSIQDMIWSSVIYARSGRAS